VSAYEGGAFEYLPKPFDIDQAVDLVRRAAQAAVKPTETAGSVVARMPELLGHAPAMQQVFRAIGRLSRSSVNVLVTGESGTGKELAARAQPTCRQGLHCAEHLGDPVRVAGVRTVRP
jgi:two-component system nitrogen regulation response regulator GlnG